MWLFVAARGCKDLMTDCELHLDKCGNWYIQTYQCPLSCGTCEEQYDPLTADWVVVVPDIPTSAEAKTTATTTTKKMTTTTTSTIGSTTTTTRASITTCADNPCSSQGGKIHFFFLQFSFVYVDFPPVSTRWWCNGQHWCLPSIRSGFDSRPSQTFFILISQPIKRRKRVKTRRDRRVFSTMILGRKSRICSFQKRSGILWTIRTSTACSGLASTATRIPRPRSTLRNRCAALLVSLWVQCWDFQLLIDNFSD